MTRRVLAAVLSVAWLVCLPAEGAAATVARSQAGGLELVGSPTQTVRFVAGEARLSILVKNPSGRPQRVALVFVEPSGARHPVREGGTRARAVDPRDLSRPLPGKTIRRIELRLLLAADRAPRDGGGVLQARVRGSAAKPAELVIRGAPPHIVFDPAKLTVDVSRACWLVVSTCNATQSVLLRGRDAVTWARRTVKPRSVAILNNDHGGSVTLLMRDVDVRDGAVRVTIDASDVSEAGRYLGRLPVEPNGLAGPGLLVEVKARWSLAAAVLAIFVGAVFGGFFLRRFEIRRRRRLLELELLSALARYDAARAEARGAPPASYDLDKLLEPRRGDKAAATPYPGTRGVSALLWHIKTARDDDDFSDDIARTQGLIAAIERWLTLEPVARETAQLLDGEPPPARGRAEWTDTIAYRDLAYLRVRATTPPADDVWCEWLTGALASQGRVAVKCKVMWELLADLEAATGWLPEQAQTIAALDVLALERAFPEFKDRTPEQTDLMLVTLGQAEHRLRRLHSDVASLDQSPRVVEAHRIEDLLHASASNPGIDRGSLDLSPLRLRLAGAFSGVALRSAIWTLARALVAAVAYALTIYSDTWGSVTDFASAFTAGFLTETIVNWAVLPAFRSTRNRGDARTSPSVLPAATDDPPPAPEPPEVRVAPTAGNGHAPAQPDIAISPPSEPGAVRSLS